MARFGDNPVKSPLAGTELLAGTDPDSGDDICVTPDEIVTYAGDNLPVAPEAFPALIAEETYDKLDELPTRADLLTAMQSIAKQPLAFFVETPVDGTQVFFTNPLDVTLRLETIFFATDSGTLTLTINKNGFPISDFSGLAVSSTEGDTISNSAELAPGEQLGFTVASNASGSGLRFSIGSRVLFDLP